MKLIGGQIKQAGFDAHLTKLVNFQKAGSSDLEFDKSLSAEVSTRAAFSHVLNSSLPLAKKPRFDFVLEGRISDPSCGRASIALQPNPHNWFHLAIARALVADRLSPLHRRLRVGCRNASRVGSHGSVT